MTKVRLIIGGSVILVFILVILISRNNHSHSDSTSHLHSKYFGVISHAVIDSLSKEREYYALVITKAGCSSCDILYNNINWEQYDLSYYFINIDYHLNNRLIAQSLRNISFPTTYIINKNHDILGIISAIPDFEQRLNDILSNKIVPRVSALEEHGVKNAFDMIQLSYKGVWALLDNNMSAVYDNSHFSLKRGSYFFNNYLLYEYHTAKHSLDSAQFYKKTALFNIYDFADIALYNDIIRNWDPNNKLLKQYDNIVQENSKHSH